MMNEIKPNTGAEMPDFEKFREARARIADDTKQWDETIAEHRGPDKDQFLVEEIAELEAPLAQVLDQLRPRIESGEYSLIIGDDVSGRLPALAVAKVIAHRYGKNQQEKPEVMFFAGTGSLAASNAGDFIDESLVDVKTEAIAGALSRQQTKGKALIVTETIVTGHGLRALVHALILAGIPYEIATVGIANPGDTQRDPAKRIEMPPEKLAEAKEGREKILGAPIYAGFGKTPSIYHDTILPGVTKDPRDIYATRVPPNGETADPEGDKIKLQRVVNEARRDVQILADHLIESYEKPKS